MEFMSLPFDIIYRVLDKMPLSDVLIFSTTSKTNRTIVKNFLSEKISTNEFSIADLCKINTAISGLVPQELLADRNYHKFMYRTDYGDGNDDFDIYVTTDNTEIVKDYNLNEVVLDNYLDSHVVDRHREYEFHYNGIVKENPCDLINNFNTVIYSTSKIKLNDIPHPSNNEYQEDQEDQEY